MPPMRFLPALTLLTSAGLVLILAGSSRAAVCREAVCVFTMEMRQQRTMVYKGPKKHYDVALNGTRLQVVANLDNPLPDDVIGRFVDAADVITADGVRRTVLTVNGQFPGPPIEVQEGSQVAVHVLNRLIRQVLTVHWHGLPMSSSPWMDGVPYVTQCPIQPNQDFTYRFLATPIGTHWYHSHVVGQQIDGLSGMLVVHPRVVPRKPLPELHLLVGDWFHLTGDEIETVSPSSGVAANKGAGEDLFAHPKYRDYSHDGVNNAALVWQSGLVNGRGRHLASEPYPLTTFRITRGTTYWFRMVNIGAEFSLRVSIDSHVMRIVSSDGSAFEPFTVDAILINTGESIDFEVKADQIEGRYWLRAQTLHDYSTYKTYDSRKHEVNAVFLYEHMSGDRNPTSIPRPCTTGSPCIVFNCPFGTFPPSYNTTCINFEDTSSMLSARHLADEYGIGDRDVHELFLNIGYNNDSSINSRRMIQPNAPLFQADATIVNCEFACADLSASCACTHILRLPFNKTIQLVLSNYQGVSYVGHHPVHLHGHKFAVMAVGYAAHHPLTGRWMHSNRDLTCLDGEKLCRNIRWTAGVSPTFAEVTHLALKDTVNVPARGYTVIRFKADNPGHWLMHCHMNHHLENGMALVFAEAVDRLPPPPPSFPTCHHFTYSSEQFAMQTVAAGRYRKAGQAAGNAGSDSVATTASGDSDTAKNSGSAESRSSDGRKQCEEKEGYTYIKATDLVGVAVGCVVLGLLVALVPIIVYVQCASSTKVEIDPAK